MTSSKSGASESVVLCIDDNDLARALIGRIVELRASTRLILAATAEEGLRLAEEERPGLILLDAGLPDSDAASVVRELRAQPSTAEIPIAIVSGWRPESVGINDPDITHIMKPFEIDDLLALLDRALGAV